MTRYLAARGGWALASLALFVTVTFFGMSLLPYDYATRFGFRCAACGADAAEALGLDRPVWEQYLDFLGELLTGSLGTSFSGRPVLAALTGHAMWVTLLVFGLGAVIAFFLGAWLGRVAAWSRSRLGTGLLNGVAILGFTIFPPFLVFLLLRWSDAPLRMLRSVLGVPPDERHVWSTATWDEVAVIQLVGVSLLLAIAGGIMVRTVARNRRWPPWVPPVAVPAGLALAVGSWAVVGAWDPAMTLLFHAPRFSGPGLAAGGTFQGAAGQGGGNVFLAIVGFTILAFGEIVLVIEASLDAESGEQYVLTARAKGLAESVVRNRHAMRNAILPGITRFVLGLPLLLTGLIIVERELELPGLSTLFFDAAREADLPLVTGALVAFGVVTLGARLALELLIVALDPRIRARGRT